MEYWRSIVELWRKQIKRARVHKYRHFGKTADRLWGFLGKNYRQLYVDTSDAELRFSTDGDGDDLYYKPRLNKTREFLSLVLPWACAKVPTRTVTAAAPPVPPRLLSLLALAPQVLKAGMEQEALAWFLQWWLSYTPKEYGAKRQQRLIAQEGLVKGRGIGWHEMVDGPTGSIPATFFGSVDHLLIDPDNNQWRDLGYVIRENHWEAWKLAEYWGVPVEEVRSARKAAVDQMKGEQEGAFGVSDPQLSAESDVCIWYEIWSRVGLGQQFFQAGDDLKDRAEALKSLGRHAYLAILPGLDYPLNVPRSIWETVTAEELTARLAWPIAFFEDVNNPFPCTPMDVYPNTDNAWATSPLEGPLPLQIFLDHLYAFLMCRIRTTSRQIIVTSKLLDEALFRAIVSGPDLQTVPVDDDSAREVDKLFKVIEFPPVNTDSWRILSAVERAYESASGMVPLMFGQQGQTQIRSAEEAGIRQSYASSRPNDYADAVEDFNAACAAKEGQMTRLYVGPQTVAPLFREPVVDDPGKYGPLTMWWAAYVNTDDEREAACDMDYSVEAGSGRRKNRQKQMSDLQTLAQYVLPILAPFAQMGVTQPFNAFMDMAAETLELPLDRVKLPEVNLAAMQAARQGPQETQQGGR